jgi:hypothetical protein
MCLQSQVLVSFAMDDTSWHHLLYIASDKKFRCYCRIAMALRKSLRSHSLPLPLLYYLCLLHYHSPIVALVSFTTIPYCIICLLYYHSLLHYLSPSLPFPFCSTCVSFTILLLMQYLCLHHYNSPTVAPVSFTTISLL